MADVLKGEVVIVTGAGRGVGAEIAKLAAAEGARVVVNDLGVSQAGEGTRLVPAEEVVQAIAPPGAKRSRRARTSRAGKAHTPCSATR